VFGRRKTETPETAPEQLPPKPGGKGRPTPSRKEAEAARKKRLAVPRNRKEASVQRREKMREARAQQRQALQSGGDDRYLPARDQGPVKRFVRDYVDSHRTIGEFMLPIFFLIFILVYVNTEWAARFSSSAFLSVIVLMIIDSVRMSRGSKAAVRAKFGADQTKGVTMYTLLRSWQMRRLRLPKPRVKAGATIT
jgi:hypothetical protein